MSGNDDIPNFVQDPCQKNGHMAVVLNNKLIALGGYEVTSPLNGGDRVHLTSSYIRTFDFSKSIDLFQTTSSDKSFQKLYHLPFRMPHVKWATFWPSSDGKKLNLWGGDYEVSAIMTGVNGAGQPIMSNSTRPVIDSNVWQVDPTDLSNEDSWKSIQSKLVNNPVPLTRATYTFDDQGQAYVYGGIYEIGSYLLANNTEYDPPVQVNMQKADLITIDNSSPPIVANNTLTKPPIGMMIRGAMHHIPSAGKKGVMVLFGGEGAARTNIDIRRAWIYDIATKNWFTQPITGNTPQNRLEFCSVLVSAEDGSSHNIFVTGGWQQPNMSALAFDDVYVLSIPSFQWINIGRAGVAKLGATCNRIGKYLIMYGGRRKSDLDGYNECTRDNIMQFYDMENLQWTSVFDYEASKASWKVPKAIYSVIGGAENGGATVLAPSAGFAYPDLQTIFKFTSTSSPNGTSHTSTPSPNSGSTSSNSKNIGGIVGGVIGGLALLGVLITLFLIRRKRQRGQHQRPEELAADNPSSGYPSSTRPEYVGQVIPPQYIHVEGKPVEMMGTEPAVEMDGTDRGKIKRVELDATERGKLQGGHVPETK